MAITAIMTITVIMAITIITAITDIRAITVSTGIRAVTVNETTTFSKEMYVIKAILCLLKPLFLLSHKSRVFQECFKGALKAFQVG